MEEAEPPANLSVGILLASPSGGGALSAVVRLIPLLETAGIGLTLLTNLKIAQFNVEPTSHIPTIVLPDQRFGSLEQMRRMFIGLPGILRAFITIRREARRRPDFVLLPFLNGTALLTLAATLGLPNPVIVCERNDPSRQRHGWHVDLLKHLLYPRSSALTVNAPGHAAREHLVRVSRGKPVHFVPNPRPREMVPADVRSSRVVLNVGRLVPQKRHATLIEAFAQVHAHIPEWTLRIVGDGPLRQPLEQLIERHGLGDKIELVGQIEDPRQHYAEAGLFVLASDYEGTSNALLEAASAGLPCIVSEETVPPSSNDVLVSVAAGSVEALAERMLAACTNDDSRKELGQAAQRWVQQVSDEDIIAEWVSVIQSASALRGRTA